MYSFKRRIPNLADVVGLLAEVKEGCAESRWIWSRNIAARHAAASISSERIALVDKRGSNEHRAACDHVFRMWQWNRRRSFGWRRWNLSINLHADGARERFISCCVSQFCVEQLETGSHFVLSDHGFVQERKCQRYEKMGEKICYVTFFIFLILNQFTGLWDSFYIPCADRTALVLPSVGYSKWVTGTRYRRQTRTSEKLSTPRSRQSAGLRNGRTLTQCLPKLALKSSWYH